MKNVTLTLYLLLALFAATARCEVSEEQRKAFLNQIPSSEQSKRDIARRWQYKREVRRATAARKHYEEHAEERKLRQKMESLGTPDRIYRSGDYESRSYWEGSTLHTIRSRDGIPFEGSTYETDPIAQ